MGLWEGQMKIWMTIKSILFAGLWLCACGTAPLLCSHTGGMRGRQSKVGICRKLSVVAVGGELCSTGQAEARRQLGATERLTGTVTWLKDPSD